MLHANVVALQVVCCTYRARCPAVGAALLASAIPPPRTPVCVGGSYEETIYKLLVPVAEDVDGADGSSDGVSDGVLETALRILSDFAFRVRCGTACLGLA